jgi:hypothetical protein
MKILLFGGHFSNLARFGGKDDMMTLLGYEATFCVTFLESGTNLNIFI